MPLFLPVWVFLSLPVLPAAPLAEADSQEVLTRYLIAQKKNVLRGVTMETSFHAYLPKLKREARVKAQRTITDDGHIHYQTSMTEGDRGLIKDVIARLMNAEEELDPVKLAQSAVTDEFYKFKFKGSLDKDGMTVHVFEVQPKKKRPGLFKGDIWVDDATGLTVRESGRLVKSPSVVIKRVDFVREYLIQDAVSVPLRTKSVSETRFWGRADVEVEYGMPAASEKTARAVVP